MVRKSAFLALTLATSLTGSASAALAAGGPATRPASKGPTVVTLSPQLNGPMAALSFVGDRVLDAARAVIGIRFVKGPNHGTVYQIHTISEGPDAGDPIGIKDSRLPNGGPTPIP